MPSEHDAILPLRSKPTPEPKHSAQALDFITNCRKCGLDLDTYQQIKDSLAAKLPEVDPEAIARLRQFGNELSSS